MPGVSVIVASYNHGPFIVEAIESILGQSMLPEEIIVIDDGSTDGTKEIVAPYVSSNFHYFRQANQGVSTARNFGLKRAHGRYLAFLDADDRWLPTMIETQLRLMESSPELVCCFGNFVRFEHVSGKLLEDQFQFYPEVSSTPSTMAPHDSGRVIAGNAFESLVQWYDFPAFMLTMLFRSERVQDLRFDPRLIRCQDAHFVLRACMRGSIGYTTDILAQVRRHCSNATRDVGMMAVDKLKALECTSEDPMAERWSQQLNARLLRARFDAATALLRKRRWPEARQYMAQALSSPGPAVRKARGVMRLGIAAVQNLARSA